MSLHPENLLISVELLCLKNEQIGMDEILPGLFDMQMKLIRNSETKRSRCSQVSPAISTALRYVAT